MEIGVAVDDAVDFEGSTEFATTIDLRGCRGVKREGLKVIRDEDARAIFRSSVNKGCKLQSHRERERERELYYSIYLFIYINVWFCLGFYKTVS